MVYVVSLKGTLHLYRLLTICLPKAKNLFAIPEQTTSAVVGFLAVVLELDYGSTSIGFVPDVIVQYKI